MSPPGSAAVGSDLRQFSGRRKAAG
jgi:hypothetical protein